MRPSSSDFLKLTLELVLLATLKDIHLSTVPKQEDGQRNLDHDGHG